MSKESLIPNNREVYLSEFFKILSRVRSLDERRALISEYVTKNSRHKYALRVFVECLYHPGINFGLPSGDLPAVGDEEEAHKHEIWDYDISFFDIMDALYPYIQESTGFMSNDLAREKKFLDMMAKLHPDERALLVAMKDKVLPKSRVLTDNLFRHKMFEEWVPGISENQK